MAKKILLSLAVISAGIVIFLYSAFWLIPSEMIEERLEETALSSGISLETDSFGKAFPLGFVMTGVKAGRGKGPAIAHIDRLRADLSILGFFKGRVGARITGEAGGGAFKGLIFLTPGGRGLDIEARGVGVNALPAIAGYGVSGATLGGRLSISFPSGGCPEGTLKAKAGWAGTDGISYKGMKIPFGEIEDSGLDAVFRDCKAVLKGAWVDGKALSLRLSGEVAMRGSSPPWEMDLMAGVTSKAGAKNEDGVLLLLTPYKKSANYYSIRIRGTIESPVLSPE